MRVLFRCAIAGCLMMAATVAYAQKSVGSDEVAKLIKSYDQREEEFKASHKQWTWEEHPVTEFRPKFKALAERYAGKPAALPALCWLVENAFTGMPPQPKEMGDWALRQMIRSHTNSADMDDALRVVDRVDSGLDREVVLRFYAAVSEANSSRNIKATALLGRGKFLLECGAANETEQDREARIRQAVQALRSVQQQHKGSDAARRAEEYLFKAENLQVGMQAPDFAGQDVDGKEVRLSQFRGRVVVLTFWGYW